MCSQLIFIAILSDSHALCSSELSVIGSEKIDFTAAEYTNLWNPAK